MQRKLPKRTRNNRGVTPRKISAAKLTKIELHGNGYLFVSLEKKKMRKDTEIEMAMGIVLMGIPHLKECSIAALQVHR